MCSDVVASTNTLAYTTGTHALGHYVLARTLFDTTDALRHAIIIF